MAAQRIPDRPVTLVTCIFVHLIILVSRQRHRNAPRLQIDIRVVDSDGPDDRIVRYSFVAFDDIKPRTRRNAFETRPGRT